LFALSVFVLNADELPIVPVEHQPFAAQVLRVLDALENTGEPLPAKDTAELKQLAGQPSEASVRRMQQILDRYCLAGVNINPESRVKAQEGPAKPELVQQGWRTFLIKVHNEAGITPVLAVDSRNAGRLAGTDENLVARRF